MSSMLGGDDLKGRKVLVTGASSGIGAALAVGFGSVGARVAVHYNRDAAGAGETAKAVQEAGGVQTIVVQGDFTGAEDPVRVVEEAADSLGGLDVLVNNAGDMLERRPLAELDDAFLDAVMQLNFGSMVRTLRTALPYLREAGGAVVNISSVAARNGGGGNSTLYAAAKGAVDSFTRGMAKELAGDGIRVNAIAPGPILTPFHTRNSDPAWLEARSRSIPLGRMGEPQECVAAALYLASNAASSYVTGQVLHVNGGVYFG